MLRLGSVDQAVKGPCQACASKISGMRSDQLSLASRTLLRGATVIMAKKRSRGPAAAAVPKAAHETFDDSEDEFLKGRDRILLDDEGPAAKRRRKIEENEADLMPSDEEVYANDILDEDEEDAAAVDDVSDEEQAAEAEDDEDDERYWGADRANYYNADAIETEQDALDEEAEARRLQQKHLQDMTDADFGFDELAWADTETDTSRKPLVEKLPPVQIPENATEQERLQILRSRYPEFEPLAQDLNSLYPLYLELRDQTQTSRKKKPSYVSTQETRYRALSAYLASIAMYMAVLTSSKNGLSLPPAELREHPIMNTLLQSRQLWESTTDLGGGDGDSQEDMAVVELSVSQPIEQSAHAPELVNRVKMTKTIDSPTPPTPSETTVATTGGKKLKKQKTLLEVNESAAPKKAKAKIRESKPKRATLEDLLAQTNPAEGDESDFGDEGPLTAEEAAEKARKKKSLRFYTSQIAQKAGKRAAASRHAGGDDDLPYKERNRDRQDRLMREAVQRNQANAAEDAGFSDEYDENDLATKMNTDANDYYATLVGANATKKADKAARAEAHRQAAAQGAQVYGEEAVGADGKRKITYAIEKNKGLTPRRKKEVRNPRVKKKMKYEEKKKKLASMRPTWKGGEGKGGYKGELTGIKSNLVKSVKL